MNKKFPFFTQIKRVLKIQNSINPSFSTKAAQSLRILATDNVDKNCIKIFQERGHKVDFSEPLKEEEIIKIIGEYDGLVVRSATKVTPKILDAARNLKIVGRAGVGVDNIDVNYATKKGVIVMNTPGGNTQSTAQLAMSLLTSMARNIPPANMSVKQGKWLKKPFNGIELKDKTIGIVGCGRIGQLVASYSKTLGMNVLGFDPVFEKDFLSELGIQKVDLETIWKKCDFITLHTPLNASTKNLVNEDVLNKCKKGVRIINCARGGIIDEAALQKALESNHVAGAALDVFSSEPPGDELKSLIGHPNLIGTPHLGASTAEAQINVSIDVANQMCDAFDEIDFFGTVNVGYLPLSTKVNMKPFMKLAETIGSIQAQISPSKIIKLNIKTFGGRDVNIESPQARSLLESMTLKGIISSLGMNLRPNLVSAPFLAKDKVIGIESSTEVDNIQNNKYLAGGNPYWNLLTIEAKRENGETTSITGAVFGQSPHIVQIEEYQDLFAFSPHASYILTFKNEDRPGAVSEVLDVIHKSRVNIASMNVARSKQYMKDSKDSKIPAICFLSLDDELEKEAMEKIKSFSSIKDVSLINLNFIA